MNLAQLIEQHYTDYYSTKEGQINYLEENIHDARLLIKELDDEIGEAANKIDLLKDKRQKLVDLINSHTTLIQDIRNNDNTIEITITQDK